MDFSLTPKQAEAQAAARRLAREEWRPEVDQWERERRVPPERYRQAADLGYTGMLCPAELGGLGWDFRTIALVLEELAQGSLALTFSLVVHNNLVRALALRGTPAQRERWLRRALDAELLGGFCLTEPGVGSDAAAITATARRDGESYVLDGEKWPVVHAGRPVLYNVLAKTDPAAGARGISAILVESDTPGMTAGPGDEWMGANAVPCGPVRFANCRVPVAQRLGEEGQGFRTALAAIEFARTFVGALSTGLAQAALDQAVAYARERQAFGQPIGQQQGLQWQLVDLATEIAAARLLTWQAAALLDAGEPAGVAAAMAKRYAADMAVRATGQAAEALGAWGYTRAAGIERYQREARMCQIIDGTSQIMRVVIGRELFGKG